MIAYHPRMANVLANMLSRKNLGRESKGKIALIKEMRSCKAILNIWSVANLITHFLVKSTLEEEIVMLQPEDPVLRKLAEEVKC